MAMKHNVYDTDTHFSINPMTRMLKNQSTAKANVIQFDHNSERFTFEIPRYIERHDMSLCDAVQVHYNNIDAKTKKQSQGVYEVTDLQISPDGDDVVILSWLISHNATQYVGSLNFLIRFACTDGNGIVEYAWNTAIYTGITVSDGIYNGEAVVDEYADILQQWKEQMGAFYVTDLTQTVESTEDNGVNEWTATFGNGDTKIFQVRNGSKGPLPKKGVDYWTEEDLAGLVADVVVALPKYDGGVIFNG